MFGAAALWPVFRCVQTLAVNLSPLNRTTSLCKLLHKYTHIHTHSPMAFSLLILLLFPVGLVRDHVSSRLPLWSINPQCLLGVVVLKGAESQSTPPSLLPPTQRACRVHTQPSNLTLSSHCNTNANVWEIKLFMLSCELFFFLSLSPFLPFRCQISQVKPNALPQEFQKCQRRPRHLCVNTSAHLMPRHCRDNTFLSYWFSFPPTPSVNVKWKGHDRLRLIIFCWDECEHFSPAQHCDWLLSVTLCLWQKTSKCVHTMHMGVRLLGQDKCIANHFELVPPARPR